MAYGKLYEIEIQNRIQNDIYRTEIWQKDFAGDTLTLFGSEEPVKLTYQDSEILEPIKASELTLSFWTAPGINIESFYSDDDEEFRVDHYFESDSAGGGTEKLLWTGYLIQDGVSEPLTDRNHVITLKATDNLALLKSVKWDEANPGSEYYGKHPLHYFIRACLTQTGLYNNGVTIPMSLPLRLFTNLFENTTDDRSDDPLVDTFGETVIDAAVFQSTDNTWDDCYTILTKILTDLNACLLQADGYWNIVRVGEYELFSNGEIPGTQYHYNGTTTDVDGFTLLPMVIIDNAGAGDCYPVEEDQTKSLQRPYKYILNTFTYNQPASFIQQVDLQLPDGATPYDTDTIGDFRYDKYDLATYFPDWIQRGGITSYFEIVTDISGAIEEEEGRYIVIIGDDGLTGGVQFNPIEVTAGDKFDFNLQWRTDTDTNSLIRFWVRFVLVTAVDTDYNLTDQAGGSNDLFQWTGPSVSADLWDTGLGIYKELTNPTDVDTTQWQQWSLADSQWSTQEIPVIPADGVLLIEVRGPNAGAQTGRQNVYFKDLRLDFTQYVNDSTQIAGQTHKDTGISTIKATNESDLMFDDSPRNTIAGTLFTNALTNFDYTDTNTGQQTLIGDRYFTRTRTWHRAEISQTLRLGNIIAYERLKMRYISRLIVEGTFRNLRYADDRFISMLSLFQFDFIGGKFFLAKSLEIDYMNCSYRATLVEVYSSDDDLDDEYLFNFFYKTD